MVLKLCVHCDPSNLWEGHPSPGRQEPPHAPVSIGVPTLVHSHVLSYPWGWRSQLFFRTVGSLLQSLMLGGLHFK